ncbi:hypothetical protein DMN91_002644 [Ooceraea biroi]|uniref:Reverse transcriptase domain-containing protein n=1 Tax=Ooceraea biroi TaxID=2015173 RepID=A0A3L8DWU9_OOCBI|nr:hypothetical protein DMN91_002644 [Ooceraea biroi]
MANWAVACVVRAIRALGLEVSPHKSEAVFFHDGLRGAPPPAQIMVGNVPVPVGPSIKYLGFTLDGRWSFEDHFVELAPRLERLAAVTSRLMPNLGGPNEKARRLYTGAIRSVALYGAPVWADDLVVTSRAAQAVRHFERRRARLLWTISRWAGPSGAQPVIRNLNEYVDLTSTTQTQDDDAMSVASEVSRRSDASRRSSRTTPTMKRKKMTQYNSDENPDGLDYITTSRELGVRIIDYADQIEAIRKKCGKIQGKLSGDMKSLLQKIKDTAFSLAGRTDPQAETEHLRRTIQSLQKELTFVKEENLALKKDFQMARQAVMPPPPKSVPPKVVTNETFSGTVRVQPEAARKAPSTTALVSSPVVQQSPPQSIDVKSITDTVVRTVMETLKKTGVLGGARRSDSRSTSRGRRLISRPASRESSRGRQQIRLPEGPGGDAWYWQEDRPPTQRTGYERVSDTWLTRMSTMDLIHIGHGPRALRTCKEGRRGIDAAHQVLSEPTFNNCRPRPAAQSASTPPFASGRREPQSADFALKSPATNSRLRGCRTMHLPSLSRNSSYSARLRLGDT